MSAAGHGTEEGDFDEDQTEALHDAILDALMRRGLLSDEDIQRLLREPPSTLVAGVLDTGIDFLRPEATLEDVSMFLATYNLVAAPVVDDDGRLLGTVTVDDLLDHLLPEGWRDRKIGSG